jgi:glycine cleavage system H protein
MKILDGVRYTKTDEWVLLDGDVATVGISDYAQSKLGDIVFVGDMTVGAVLKAGDLLVSIESVKAATDVYSPVAGTILEANSAVTAKPELLNADPFGAGWLARIKTANADELNALMSSSDYAEFRKG